MIVPHLAMSAATMISCAADKILMGEYSFLGPIDPQLLVATPLGQRSVPAQAVLDQFDKAQQECTEPQKLAAWAPMLGQYGPDLLVQCEMALKLARKLVGAWLKDHMFRGEDDAEARAQRISDWLSNHTTFMSHARHLSRDELQAKGLLVSPLEDDRPLRDLSLSVFHAAVHTFSATPAVKIVENHRGRAFIKNLPPPLAPLPPLQIGIGPPPPSSQPSKPPKAPPVRTG